MGNPDCSRRRICPAQVFALAAIMVLLLACPARVDAAVYLLYFRATGEEDRVVLQWETAQELDNLGFNLHRAEVPELIEAQKLNQWLIPSEAFGGVFGASYSYQDTDVVEGVTYYYWLESVDMHSVGKFYSDDPESAAPGGSPSPTSTSTPAETATSTPTATATSTRTRVPTATATTVPTATPSSTATVVPTSTPASTPTVTPGGMAQPTMTPGTVYGERTPMPTSTTVAGAAETSTATTVAWGGDSQPGAPGWSSFLVHWPTIHPSTILLLISLVSLLGVLLLSVALALVRKLSL
ncbi:MAG: hypothetical protein WCD51_01670 [Anaerolineae bacterium]